MRKNRNFDIDIEFRRALNYFSNKAIEKELVAADRPEDQAHNLEMFKYELLEDRQLHDVLSGTEISYREQPSPSKHK